MYNSLKEKTKDFHLFIFALDNLCYKILTTLNLENSTIIPLSDFENDDLLNAKKDRTKAEYCWTCTSSAIEYILLRYNVSSCTYLDADLFFYSSPKILFDELPNRKSVLITDHRYSLIPKYLEQKRAGRFCVQFVTFKNQPDSRLVLTDWKNKCIEWCYNRYEDNKFGDQKYLDVWPDKYENIHILNNLGGGVAPWNIGQYRISEQGNGLFLLERSTKKVFELIFYHFHFVRFMENGTVDLGWNFINKSVVDKIYLPYILKIIETEKILIGINNEFSPNYSSFSKENIKGKGKYFFKRVSKFNILVTPGLNGTHNRS